MSLESSIESLRRKLAALQDSISDLQVTVSEDKPSRGSAVLVDRLDNVVTELASALEEASARSLEASLAARQTSQLDQCRHALHGVHELINRFTALHADRLAAHDPVSQLLEMGRERGREWREWSQEVKTAIVRVAAPTREIAGALLECWSELAERLARGSLSVQSTNIGQQITLREDQLELAGKAT
jgi:hypothetical protein